MGPLQARSLTSAVPVACFLDFLLFLPDFFVRAGDEDDDDEEEEDEGALRAGFFLRFVDLPHAGVTSSSLRTKGADNLPRDESEEEE